jgi:long-chain fatty acid transport protein
MRRILFPLMFVVCCLQWQPAFAQFGLNFSGVGPVNRSMGGVATATPIDSLGAIHWNPATIAALPSSEMSFGVDGVLPVVDITSSLGPFAGGDDSDGGWFAAPLFGVVQQVDDSEWTYGLGIMTVAGFGQNFPASSATGTTNPVLFPGDGLAENGGIPGFGNIFAEAAFIEIAPVLALQVTENLSIGFGPTVTIGRVQASPFAFAPPDNANAIGFPTFPDGTNARYHWGGGFQMGAYLETDQCVNFGVSYKSPQWFENFTANSTDEIGRTRNLNFSLDLPQIVSFGASYTGMQNVLLGVDVRHIGWSHADLFGDPASFSNGALRGLGWDSTWNVSVGGQYLLSERLTVRAGYAYGPSPIDGNPESGLNVGTPLILEHILSAGTSVRISDALSMHVAYTYAIENELNGPIQGPAGPVGGSTLSQQVSAHFLTAGFTAAF